jgi:hypothetical protein
MDEKTVETESIKDLKNGQKVRITGIALKDREFFDANTKAKVSKLVMIIRTPTGYYQANENTVIYNQLIDYVSNVLNQEFPVKKMDMTFTVVIKKSGASAFSYPAFEELMSQIDPEKLFK